ncbi:MAG TPA: protein kinase [Bryobacteraceae bacterium]|nr:protein kinase [Bryobacteraceae bacterium]
MTVLGKYEIIEQLGTGAKGSLYRARDTVLEREVALETIQIGADVDPAIRRRFYAEARACARLQHPGIVTIYDLGEIDNSAYLAIELLQGFDFRRIIQDRKPLPVETKVAAVAQVCEALAYAHRQGVVCREIKPSHLFLTQEGRAKVLDFGIARLSGLTTQNYMAPEQILGQPADGRSGLFSVAVVLFELLTYSHPFQGALIPRRIVQDDPDSLFDHDSTLPPILERVIARGLAKDPGHRYQTGDEFAADLYTVLDAIRHNAMPSFSGGELLPRAEGSPPVAPAAKPVRAPKPERSTFWAGYAHLIGRLDSKTTRRVSIAGTGAVCAILFIAALIHALRPVPIETAAATAVASRNTALYEMPRAQGKPLSIVLAGTRLNVLELPGSSGQPWIRVQRLTPKVLRPGYVRLEELGDWDPKTGAAALALAHVFAPDESAATSQIQDQIDKLNAIASRFPGEAAAHEATLDALEWKLRLIRREQESGAPPADLLLELSAIRAAAEPFAGDNKLQQRVLTLLNQIDPLIASIQLPAPPAQPALAPPPDIRGWFERASKAWDDGDYTSARQNLNRVLQYQPDNQEARALKTRLDRAQAVEKSYER